MPFSKTKQETINTFLDDFIINITDSYYDNIVVKELLKDCCDDCKYKDTSKPTEDRKKLWWKELPYTHKLQFIDSSYKHIVLTLYKAEERIEFLEEENKEWEENVEELQEEVEALEDKIYDLEQKPPAYNEIKQN